MHCPPPPALGGGCHNDNKEVDLPPAVQQALRVALAANLSPSRPIKENDF